MSATYYLRSVAGGHHKPGAVIWGPYTLEDAHGMQRASANPLEIVPADQLSRDDLTIAVQCKVLVECFACGHTETGYSHHPHDTMTDHYVACLHRAKPCGCHLDGPDRTDVWTCDDHATAYLRERTAWRIANHEARRWTPRRDEPEQLTLDFTEQTA